MDLTVDMCILHNLFFLLFNLKVIKSAMFLKINVILELRNTEEYINYYFFFHFKVKASEEEKWTRLSQAGRTYLIPLQYVFRNNYVVSPCQI